MSKEIRTIFLIALTLVVYATLNFTSTGGFIFPYPLNSIIFFIVTLQFSFWNFQNKILVLSLFAIGLMGILGNIVFWETIISENNLQLLQDSLWLKVFHYLFGSGLLVWVITMMYRQKSLQIKILTSTGILFFGVGYFDADELILLIGLFILALSSSISPIDKPFHRLWLLLFILETTKWLSVVLN